jgi:hypothetical protein
MGDVLSVKIRADKTSGNHLIAEEQKFRPFSLKIILRFRSPV